MRIFLAGCALAAALAFVFFAPSAELPEQRAAAETAATEVMVYDLYPRSAQDIVTVFGDVKARWNVRLKAEVSGRVQSVSEAALLGALVKKGAPLVVIEDTAQRLEVANQQAAQAVAQRAVLEEEQRALIAQQNWTATGYQGDPDPLVLRVPQLQEAKARLNSATLALKRAEYMLDQTVIRAPFDGAVTQRMVSPGDFIQAGADVLQLYDTSRMEVVLPVTETQLHRLSGEGVDAKVVLRSDQTDGLWHGTVERVGRQVDTKNRLINLIVTIDQPSGLVPGQFLAAEVVGKTYDSVFAIPQALVGRDGGIWHVDDAKLLRRLTVDPLFAHDGLVYVQRTADWPSALRLTPPSGTYLEGRAVMPWPAQNHAEAAND